MPEAAHALAQAAIYLALAPKSNAAYQAHRPRPRARPRARRPAAARAAALRGLPGRGGARARAGYDYPHDRPGHLSRQELMPDALAGERFYEPDDAEAEPARRMEEIRSLRSSRSSG